MDATSRIIAEMAVVIAAGWAARRFRLLSSEAVSAASRFVVDVALPALILEQMISSLDGAMLSAGWRVPVAALGVLVAGWLVGLATAPLFTRPRQRRTFVFLVSVANWVYLPLPIASALYGDVGRIAVLLGNAGAMVALWTLGVWTLKGGVDSSTFKGLAVNPGLWATVVGVAASLLFPGLRAAASGEAHGAMVAVQILLGAARLLGSLTVPLSLVIIGAQLAEVELRAGLPLRALGGALLARLVLTPLLFAAALAALGGAGLSPEQRRTLLLVACMPSAVNCSVFAARFGQDVRLASTVVALGTIAAIVTVPLLVFLTSRIG